MPLPKKKSGATYRKERKQRQLLCAGTSTSQQNINYFFKSDDANVKQVR